MVRGFCHDRGARWSEARPELGNEGGCGTRSLRPDGVRLGLGVVVKSGLMICVRSSRMASGSLEGSEWHFAVVCFALSFSCLRKGVAPCSGMSVSKGKDKMAVILPAWLHEAEQSGHILLILPIDLNRSRPCYSEVANYLTSFDLQNSTQPAVI